MKLKKVTQPINWNEIELLEMKHALWQTTYCPRCYAKIAILDECIVLNMFCEELNPKAIYTKMNDPVYKDSCMEAFFNFNPEKTNNYLNIEVNANGAMLLGFGENRRERKLLTATFHPKPYRDHQGWGFMIEIPLDFIKYYFGHISNEWRANFYKCGDDCEYEHYLSWNKIELETPNFHCPEYFGNIQI